MAFTWFVWLIFAGKWHLIQNLIPKHDIMYRKVLAKSIEMKLWVYTYNTMSVWAIYKSFKDFGGPLAWENLLGFKFPLLIALWNLVSFAFFCCHLRYAGFGHINQKLSPYCSRGSSRKQYSHFFMWKLRGSAFCRNLSLCLLHFLWTTYKDIVYRHILRFIRCNCFTWAVVNTSWQGS